MPSSLLAGCVMVAGFLWYSLLSDAQDAAARFDKPMIAAFQMDSPAFWPSFWEGVRGLVDPTVLLAVSGAGPVLMLLGASVVVVFFWRVTRFPFSSELDRRVSSALVLLPAIVGFGLVPIVIRKGFRVLAEAGLSSPEIVAAVTGEAFAPLLLGLLMSLLFGITCGCLWWRLSRSQKALDDEKSASAAPEVRTL